MTREVDPITLQVIGGALHAIAEQMGNVLYRMSSSIVRKPGPQCRPGLRLLCDRIRRRYISFHCRKLSRASWFIRQQAGSRRCVIHNHPYVRRAIRRTSHQSCRSSSEVTDLLGGAPYRIGRRRCLISTLRNICRGHADGRPEAEPAKRNETLWRSSLTTRACRPGEGRSGAQIASAAWGGASGLLALQRTGDPGDGGSWTIQGHASARSEDPGRRPQPSYSMTAGAIAASITVKVTVQVGATGESPPGSRPGAERLQHAVQGSITPSSSPSDFLSSTTRRSAGEARSRSNHGTLRSIHNPIAPVAGERSPISASST